MKHRLVIASTALALAVGLAAGGLWWHTRREAAPPVTYTVLDGTQHQTAALKGKVVLVNFWATSCTTCLHEMPKLVATHRQYQPQGLEMLAVALQSDPPAYVVHYAESRQLPFPVVIDNTGDFAQRFGNVQLTPTTVVIDKQGRIVKRYVGEPDFVQLHALLDKLLAES